MDERYRLIRAIEAEPDDDLPRLVFADWLEEHGDEARARFIRLQCRWSRLRESLRWKDYLESPEGKADQAEIVALEAANWDAWTSGLPEWAFESIRWFDRGFLDLGDMTGRQFLADAATARVHGPLN